MKKPLRFPCWPGAGQILLVLLVAAILISTGKADELNGQPPAVKSEAIESAVKRSLSYLAKRGDWWIDKKQCMSCHRTSFTAWSHIEASAAGLKTDTRQVGDWIDWNHEQLFRPVAEKDRKHPDEKTIERNLSGAAQMLALAEHWKSSASQEAFQRKIVRQLKSAQQADGLWIPGGQLPFQRRSVEETTQVITLWNAMALHKAASYEHLHEMDIQPIVARAEKSINAFANGKSSEWMGLRYLFASYREDVEGSKRFRQQLMEAQNTDGGWGWIAGQKSDALATAQVLFVLLDVEPKTESESVQRAIRYLLKTQSPAGSWQTEGTKSKAKGRVTETATYWGSAWACIALSRSLKAVRPNQPESHSESLDASQSASRVDEKFECCQD